MLLNKPIPIPKKFLHKTLRNLMSFLFGRYQKLPKANPPLDHFSSSDTPPKIQQWESNHDEAIHQRTKSITSVKDVMTEDNASSKRFMNYAVTKKKTQEEREREENRRGHVLAQKMRELEMMDVNDVDHVLDIKEVLHYYSLLRSPVYLDLVDGFFMDMYSEFFLPQPSFSVNNSMRRLGPVKV